MQSLPVAQGFPSRIRPAPTREDADTYEIQLAHPTIEQREQCTERSLNAAVNANTA